MKIWLVADNQGQTSKLGYITEKKGKLFIHLESDPMRAIAIEGTTDQEYESAFTAAAKAAAKFFGLFRKPEKLLEDWER